MENVPGKQRIKVEKGHAQLDHGEGLSRATPPRSRFIDPCTSDIPACIGRLANAAAWLRGPSSGSPTLLKGDS